MKKFSIFLVSVFIAFVFAGCDFGLSKDDDNKSDSCTVSLTVLNSSSHIIDELYFVQSDSETWGNNYLSSYLNPSGSFTITNIPAPDSYDALVFDTYAYYTGSVDNILDCSSAEWSWTITDSSGWYYKSSIPGLKSDMNLPGDGSKFQPVE